MSIKLKISMPNKETWKKEEYNKITFEFVSIHLSIHVDSFSFRSRLILYH